MRPQRSRLIGERCLGRRTSVRDRGGLALEAEVRKDAPRDDQVGDQGDELAPLAAVLAAQDIDREDASHELGPAVPVRGASDGGGDCVGSRDLVCATVREPALTAHWVPVRTFRPHRQQALASARSGRATRQPVPGHRGKSVDARAGAARAPRDLILAWPLTALAARGGTHGTPETDWIRAGCVAFPPSIHGIRVVNAPCQPESIRLRAHREFHQRLLGPVLLRCPRQTLDADRLAPRLFARHINRQRKETGR